MIINIIINRLCEGLRSVCVTISLDMNKSAAIRTPDATDVPLWPLRGDSGEAAGVGITHCWLQNCWCYPGFSDG